MARPGGRAGGERSAHQRGGPRPTGGPDGHHTGEGRHVALGEIRVPDNVRALDPEHVKALARSIKLQGMLVPVVVRDDSQNGFELVAGFHRVAAARALGLAEVPVVVRDVETEDADRAVENIASCRCPS